MPIWRRSSQATLKKKKGTSFKEESGSVAELAEQVRLWILEVRRKQMKRIHRKEKKVKKETAKVYEDRDGKEADSEAASPLASPTLSTCSSVTDGSMTDEISRVSLDHLEVTHARETQVALFSFLLASDPSVEIVMEIMMPFTKE